MRAALVLALLLGLTGTAMATSVNETGPFVPVDEGTWVGERPTNVAVFMDYLPWGYDTVRQILQSYGVSYSTFGSASMGTVDLSPFDKVIIVSNQDSNFYNTLQTYRSRFEDYMRSGGCMLMCCAGYFGSGGEYITWPGGFMHQTVDCINNVTIMVPSHPVFNTPLPVGEGNLDGWYCSSHGTFINLPAGAMVTVENAEFAPGTPAAFDFCFGAGGGYVVAQPFDWIGPGNPYAINVVLYECGGGPSPVESQSWGEIKSLFR